MQKLLKFKSKTKKLSTKKENQKKRADIPTHELSLKKQEVRRKKAERMFGNIIDERRNNNNWLRRRLYLRL